MSITKISYTLAGLLLLVYPVIVLFAAENPDLDMGTRVSLGTGYIAVALLCLQMILSARVPVLDRVFGSDQLIVIHRFVGSGVLTLVLLHSISGILRFTTGDNVSLLSLPPFGIAVTGAISTTLLVIVVVIGTRQAHVGAGYEQWRQLHRIAYYTVPAVLIHMTVSGRALAEIPLLMIHSLLLTVLAFLAVATRGMRYFKAVRHPLSITEVIARGTEVTSIRLERPARFRFAPGQYCELGTRHEPTHPFSISSGTEDPYLEFTARAVGDFSRTWQQFDRCTEAILTGPMGKFTPENIIRSSHLVLLAGGIGITPFMSMVRSNTFWQYPGLERATLVWSVQAADIPLYLDEIAAHSREYPLHPHLVVTSASEHRVLDDRHQPEISVYTGSRISATLFSRMGITATPAVNTYALCGPPEFETTCSTLLREAGVSRRRIIQEKFRL